MVHIIVLLGAVCNQQLLSWKEGSDRPGQQGAGMGE
jgi:hypothetical protein